MNGWNVVFCVQFVYALVVASSFWADWAPFILTNVLPGIVLVALGVAIREAIRHIATMAEKPLSVELLRLVLVRLESGSGVALKAWLDDGIIDPLEVREIIAAVLRNPPKEVQPKLAELKRRFISADDGMQDALVAATIAEAQKKNRPPSPPKSMPQTLVGNYFMATLIVASMVSSFVLVYWE